MDGGMNPAFQGKYKTSLVRLADGKVHTMVEERATGSVPAYTDTQREPPPAADSTVMTSARFGSQSSGNFFTRLFGGGRAEDEKPQAAAAQPAAPAPAAKPAPVRTATAAAKPAPKAEPKPESRQEARAQPAQPPQPKPHAEGRRLGECQRPHPRGAARRPHRQLREPLVGDAVIAASLRVGMQTPQKGRFFCASKLLCL